MIVHFKLVGNATLNKVLICEDYPDDGFTLKMVLDTFNKYFELIKKYEINPNNEFLNDRNIVKFITNTEQMKDLEKKYELKFNKKNLQVNEVFVFSSDTLIRNAFKKIVEIYGEKIEKNTENKNEVTNINNDIDKFENKLYEEELNEDDHVLSEKELEEQNNNLLQTFEDEDFKKLLEIYINKPELFNMLYQYVDNGNIINDFDCTNEVENFKYEKEYSFINDFSFNFNEKIIKNTLNNFDGHIGLSLRYLIFKSCEEKKNKKMKIDDSELKMPSVNTTELLNEAI